VNPHAATHPDQAHPSAGAAPPDPRSRPPLAPALGPLAAPAGDLLAPLYAAAVRARNKRFDRGRHVQRVHAPVISVGNLSVGGTGKTPMVAYLADLLRQLGRSPGIAMRGYKAKPGEKSDEQLEHEAALPGVPVEADPLRADAARRLIERRAADAVLLDDGFQHRKLHRDLDIVLIDATRDPFVDKLLPAGWLREPVESLARAHVVVVTRVDAVTPAAVERLARRVRKCNERAVIAAAAHQWAAFMVGHERQPLDAFRTLDAVAALGIGHPAAFLHTAAAHSLNVTRAVVKPDHHHWTADEARHLIDSLTPGARLLTTEKDWVKLARLIPKSDHWQVLRPQLRLTIKDGEARLRSAIERALEP